ncbi:helix-turn-helix transcriptional regulator [Leucobacter aridicollis]|uniref:helix-turn-helix transcriptional regulator n=1 Tax=Leucobacter aridicollis TaxID=283878 RepID=UPI00216A3ACF|nr:WYL domain-containing protein [Leucobacter aridicollis]MCS3428147.1 putative DNA-binding transcriptional regulator YafY [Leucobacter aridicollis]
MRRSERLHAMTESLRRSGARGVTADRLAAEYGVSLRTVKRDIDALENSGLPIWARPGPGGGYGMLPQGNLPPISLSPAQAVALLAAVSAAPDAPYADLASAGVRKILDVLDPGTRARADDLAQRIWVNGDGATSRPVRSALEEAMAEQRVARIRYRSAAGDETVRDVEPVIFASTGGRWYLIGWCRLRDAMRWFLISRVVSARVTREVCVGHTVEEIGAPPASATALSAHG